MNEQVKIALMLLCGAVHGIAEKTTDLNAVPYLVEIEKKLEQLVTNEKQIQA